MHCVVAGPPSPPIDPRASPPADIRLATRRAFIRNSACAKALPFASSHGDGHGCVSSHQHASLRPAVVGNPWDQMDCLIGTINCLIGAQSNAIASATVIRAKARSSTSAFRVIEHPLTGHDCVHRKILGRQGSAKNCNVCERGFDRHSAGLI